MAMAAEPTEPTFRMDATNITILRFIDSYVREVGFSPSVREIAAEVSTPAMSSATVHSRLKWLERNGWITWPIRQASGQRAAGAIRVRNLRKAEKVYEKSMFGSITPT